MKQHNARASDRNTATGGSFSYAVVSLSYTALRLHSQGVSPISAFVSPPSALQAMKLEIASPTGAIASRSPAFVSPPRANPSSASVNATFAAAAHPSSRAEISPPAAFLSPPGAAVLPYALLALVPGLSSSPWALALESRRKARGLVLLRSSNRCPAPVAASGGFDSHALPPVRPNYSQHQTPTFPESSPVTRQ